MLLNEIKGEKPLVVSMYEKIRASRDSWGVYWVDANGIGHSIYDMEWVPAEKYVKEKILVTLNSQNRPKPRVLRFTGAGIEALTLKKKLVPKQFAVDYERWYLIDRRKEK
jgi:hypothetical protein